MPVRKKNILPELLISRLSYNHFYVIGHAGLEFHPQPISAKIEFSTYFKAEIGGNAANIAVALSQQGLSATLITPLLNNVIGRLNIMQLEAFDVDTRNLVLKKTLDKSKHRSLLRNPLSTLGYSEINSKKPYYISCRNNISEIELSSNDLKNIPYKEIGGLIITGSILSSLISRQLVLQTIKQAKIDKVPIIIDLDCCSSSWDSLEDMQNIFYSLFNLADIVFGSKQDYTLLAGSQEAGVKLSQLLVTKYNSAFSVYKMGEQGTQTFTRKGVIRMKAFPILNSIKFCLGSSEAFLAGVISALTEDASLQQAISKGSIAASIVASKPGRSSAMPTRAMLNSLVRKMNNENQNI